MRRLLRIGHVLVGRVQFAAELSDLHAGRCNTLLVLVDTGRQRTGGLGTDLACRQYRWLVGGGHRALLQLGVVDLHPKRGGRRSGIEQAGRIDVGLCRGSRRRSGQCITPKSFSQRETVYRPGGGQHCAGCIQELDIHPHEAWRAPASVDAQCVG
ncbi:hypothetical protein D3C80_1389750 [compost metagenome]